MRWFDIRVIKRGDIPLAIGVAVLLFFGFAAIFSVELSRGAESVLLLKQVIALGIGLVASIVLGSTNYHMLRYGARGLYVFGIVLLIFVLFFGRTLNGATGWFVVGGFAFQPIEFMKVALVVMLVRYFSLAAHRRLRWRDVGMSAAITALPVLLAVMQPDLGGAALLLGTWVIFVLFAGIRLPQIAAILLSVVCIAGIGWFGIFKEYQKERILTFIDPSRDALDSGYNVIQAQIAVGAGGLWGRGLGDGSQGQLRFLPESQTDFVFAVIAEELGFVGVVFLLSGCILVLWRIVRLAERAPDTFGAYLCLGSFSVLLTEMTVHVGANLSLLPATGVALPFVSYGGSSLLLSFIFFGMVQSVAVRLRPGGEVESSEEYETS